MKLFSIYLIFFFLLSTGIGKSQVPVTDMSLRLEGLFDRLVDNYIG